MTTSWVGANDGEQDCRNTAEYNEPVWAWHPGGLGLSPEWTRRGMGSSNQLPLLLPHMVPQSRTATCPDPHHCRDQQRWSLPGCWCQPSSAAVQMQKPNLFSKELDLKQRTWILIPGQENLSQSSTDWEFHCIPWWLWLWWSHDWRFGNYDPDPSEPLGARTAPSGPGSSLGCRREALWRTTKVLGMDVSVPFIDHIYLKWLQLDGQHQLDTPHTSIYQYINILTAHTCGVFRPTVPKCCQWSRLLPNRKWRKQPMSLAAVLMSR